MSRLKYLLRNLIVTVLLSSFSMSLFAQVDTAFWFAVPHLTTEHQHVPITLVVTAFGESATVTVTKPASATPAVATFTVPANSSGTQVLVPDAAGLSGFECAHNTTSNNGLFIQSTAKITAYIAVQQNNSEIYALKGKNGMGTQFFVTSQFQYDNGNGTSSGAYSQAKNAIEIISTEDNNSVTIVPSVACGSHPAGVAFTVTLQKGQVYCLAATSQQGANHICGTTITSTKPVVVDVSDDSVTPHSTNPNVTTDNGNGSADLVADQLVPESMAGSQYVVVPSPSAVNNVAPAGSGSGDYYLDYAFVFALQDNTTVSVYSTASATPTTYTMNRGDKQKIHFSSTNPIFIYATTEPDPVTGAVNEAPIFVFQITGAGKEFGGTNLPQFNCTGSYDIGYTPILPANAGHSKRLFISLICKTEFISGFQLIGNNTNINSSDWQDVPGTFGEYKYCRKKILDIASPTQVQMTPFRVTNTLGKFHMGVFDINGSYDDCSIGYFSNYAPEEYVHWDTTVTLHDYCEGDTIRFAFDSVDIYINSILLPSDSTVNYGTGPDEITEIPNVTPDQSGLYKVYAAGNCANDIHIDSIYITVHPTVYTTLYDTICPGTEYFGPNNFYFSEQATTEPGTLRDSIRLQTVEFGCDSIVRLELTVRDSVFGEFSHVACNQYTWNGQTYTQTGDYTQTLTGASVHGCDSVVTLHLDIEEPAVHIVTSEDDFCEFGELVLTAETDYEEYIWNTGETTPFISVTQPGIYSVTVTQGECQAYDNYTVPTCEFHIFMPNSITPSRSDGLNDYLYLPQYVHRFITEFEIEIYDRWGELIYWNNDKNFKWYGEKAHVSDVYIWIIRVKNLEGKAFVYRGTVTVL